MLREGLTAEAPYGILLVESKNGTSTTTLLQDCSEVLQGIGK